MTAAPAAPTRPDGPEGPRGSRPAAVTGRGSLLAAELGRLRRRRLVLVLVGLGLAGLLVGLAVVFATHSTDLAGARAAAVIDAQQQAQQQSEAEAACRQDAGAGADAEQACDFGDPPTAEDMLRDPRFFAETGLPVVVVAVGVAGALLAALVGATAVGADWSSRAVITLLTWEPRRLRFLGTRLAAVALATAALGVLAQALALGLGALTVQLRGDWGAPPAQAGLDGDPGTAFLPHATFWRDLLSLQLRCVVLMVLAALLAASVTALTRHTGGLLGLMFAWFAVAENAVRVLASERGWSRWLVTENILAFLLPGGQQLPAGGQAVSEEGLGGRTVLVSNLDALLYLGVLTAVAAAVAGLLLRRRDL